MTEAEMKTKLCPKSIGHIGNDGRFYCATTECAVWRWHETKEWKGKPPAARKVDMPRDKWKGHCGLAGKPSC